MFRTAIASIMLATQALAAPGQDEPHAVALEGDGAETYVLITGMLGGIAGFGQIDSLLLARGYRVLRIDPYQLSLDSSDVSFAAMARRVEAVMAHYHIRKARIVGHSHGAGVALRLAAAYPGEVESLYLLEAGALAYNHGPTLSSSLRFVPVITRLPGGRSMVRKKFIDGLKRSSGQTDWLNDEKQRAYTAPLLDNVDRMVDMAFRLYRASEPESLTTVVAHVRTPLLVVMGAAQHDAGIGQEELDALAPLGSLVQIRRLEGVGHFPQEESPNELVRLLILPLPAPALTIANGSKS